MDTRKEGKWVGRRMDGRCNGCSAGSFSLTRTPNHVRDVLYCSNPIPSAIASMNRLSEHMTFQLAHLGQEWECTERQPASQPVSFIGVCPLSHSQVKRCTACNIFPPEQYHRTRSIVSLTTKEDKQSLAIQQTCLSLRLVAHHNLQQNVGRMQQAPLRHNNQLIKQQNSRGIKLQKRFLF